MSTALVFLGVISVIDFVYGGIQFILLYTRFNQARIVIAERVIAVLIELSFGVAWAILAGTTFSLSPTLVFGSEVDCIANTSALAYNSTYADGVSDVCSDHQVIAGTSIALW